MLKSVEKYDLWNLLNQKLLFVLTVRRIKFNVYLEYAVHLEAWWTFSSQYGTFIPPIG